MLLLDRRHRFPNQPPPFMPLFPHRLVLVLHTYKCLKSASHCFDRHCPICLGAQWRGGISRVAGGVMPHCMLELGLTTGSSEVKSFRFVCLVFSVAGGPRRCLLRRARPRLPPPLNCCLRGCVRCRGRAIPRPGYMDCLFEGSVFVAKFSPDGTKLATGCKNGRVRVFDTDEWSALEDWAGHTATVSPRHRQRPHQ